MKVIADKRQTGRTTKLIEMAAEAEKRGEVSYIVCSSQRECTRIFHAARNMGLSIGFPITYNEFLQQHYAGRNIKNFYIDNVEMLLPSLTSVHIAAITVTTKDTE